MKLNELQAQLLSAAALLHRQLKAKHSWMSSR